MDGGHPVGARGGQRGSGKALEGDDRQTDLSAL